MKNKLNPRQKNFVIHYLQTLNATKAAKMAGYSEKTARIQGSKNLTKANIFEAINQGLEIALENEKTIFKYETLGMLRKIINADIDNMNDDSTVIAGRTFSKDGKEQIKLFDKNTAINTALKYMGLLDNDENNDIREIKLVVELDDRYKIKDS